MRKARERSQQIDKGQEDPRSGKSSRPERDSTDLESIEVLRESESLYRLLAENSTDLITKHAIDGVYTYVSPVSKILLGYDPEELLGRSAYDFFHPDDLEEISRVHSAALEEQRAHTISYRIRRRDGEYTWFETTVRTDRNETTDEAEEIVAVSRDITDRIEAETGLQEAEYLYRTLVEQIPAVIYTSKSLKDPGSTRYVSPQIESLLGYPSEDFVENSDLWKEILHPEDRDRVIDETIRAAETGEPFNAEYRVFTRDGKEIWLQDEAVLVRDGARIPRFWQGVKVNITDQKKTELQLRESSDRIASILESTTDAFFSLDHDRRFTFVNERAAQILRQPQRELLGASVSLAFPESTESRFYTECQRVATTGQEAHFEEFYPPLGKWLEVHAYPYEENISVYFRDITERKIGEEQLREAEALFRSAFDNTAMGMALVSLEGRYMQVNQALCELLGYSEKDLLDRTYMDITYHKDYETSMLYVHRVNSGQLDNYALEKRYVHAEGYPIWVSLSISVVRDSEGGPLYYVAQIKNIEERKQAEAALQEDTERLAAIISTQRAIAVAEPDQKSVMNLIVERTRELTGADGAVFQVIEGEDLVYHTASGKAQEYIGLRLSLSTSISGECVRRREILRSDDTERDARVDRAVARQVGIRSLIVVPLHHHQEIVGVLNIFSTRVQAFGNRDVDTLQLMAGLIAAAMSHTAEFEAKQELLDERTSSLIKIQESEARFRAIFEGSTSSTAIVSLDGLFLQTNPALHRMLGYTSEELKGMRYTEITHPEDVRRDLALFEELAAGRRDNYELEKRYIHKDGRLLWGRLGVSMIHTPDESPNFAVGMIEDITARKKAEEEIQKRAQQQAVVARIGQRALAETELDYLVDEAVTLVAETLETRYAKFLEFLPERDELLLRAGTGWKKGYVGCAKVSTGSETQSGYTLFSREPVITEDLVKEDRFGASRLQEEHRVTSGVSVIVPGADHPLGILGVDATSRRTFTGDDVNFMQSVANVLATAIGRAHARDALRKSEREYRRLFELANDAILIYDSESLEILDVNENACEIYGYPRETFVGMSIKDISLDRQNARRYLDVLLARSSYQDFETIHRRYDGNPINVLVNSSVIEFKGKCAVLSINRDVTARRRTEASLMEIREAERRRIARDLHDAVLQDLSGTLQGLQAFKVESGSKGLPVDLDNEINALRRATSGLRGAIYDLRQEKEEPFVRAVESLVELSRQLNPERQIMLSVSDNFTSELEQEVSVELLKVLQEALANTRHHSDARNVKVSLCQKESEIVAEVYDDGCGFDISTNRAGGVGLSGMRERVEEIGGEIEIKSEPGKGTLVKVSVPYKPVR